MKKNKQGQDQSIYTTIAVIIWLYRPRIASSERRKGGIGLHGLELHILHIEVRHLVRVYTKCITKSLESVPQFAGFYLQNQVSILNLGF